MADIEDLEKGMIVDIKYTDDDKTRVITDFGNETTDEAVYYKILESGNEYWELPHNLEVINEPLYPIGTKLKVIDPDMPSANHLKGKIVEVVGSDDPIDFEVRDSNACWFVSNLGEYEVIEEPKEYDTYHATECNLSIDLSEIDTEVIENAITKLDKRIFGFGDVSYQINNKGEDSMNGVNTQLEHMDVYLNIDLKRGGYLVTANTDEFVAEAVDSDYLNAIDKAIDKIRYKQDEEETRENEIERVKKEIEAQKERLKQLKEE